jgi:hypothetical protein
MPLTAINMSLCGKASHYDSGKNIRRFTIEPIEWKTLIKRMYRNLSIVIEVKPANYQYAQLTRGKQEGSPDQILITILKA